MKLLKKKLDQMGKRNISLCLFFGNFVIFFTVYSVLFNDIYSADSIDIANSGINVLEYCYAGRYMLAFMFSVLNAIGFECTKHQFLIQFLRILVCSYFAVYLTDKFYKLKKDRTVIDAVILNVIILISLLNVFFVETFMFVSPDWMFGLFLIILVCEFFIRQKYVWSFLSMFLAVSIYQTWIFVFFSIITCYLLLAFDFKLNMLYFKKFIYTVVISLGTALLNLLSVKVFTNIGIFPYEVKQTNIPNLFIRTKEIAILFKNILKDGLGMMPRFTVFFILLIYAVIIAHYFYKHRMLKEALWVCCAVGAIFLCCFSLSYLQKNMYLPGRIIFPFFFALAFTGIMAYFLCDSGRKKIILCVMCGIFLVISSHQVQQVSLDRYTSNQLDFEYARIVVEKINNYERQSGNKVYQIKIYPLKNYIGNYYRKSMLEPSYPVVMNTRILFEEWGVIPLINYVNGTNYSGEVLTLEEYNEIFGSHEWNEINLDGNEMFWAVF